MGMLFSKMYEKTVYEYTSKAVPQIDIRGFKKKHMAEYKAMVARTPSVGSMKENMFAPVMYLACYGFAYYKADPEHITMEVFDGMIDAICKCDTMKRFYKRSTNMFMAPKDRRKSSIPWTGSSIFPMIFRFRSIT